MIRRPHQALADRMPMAVWRKAIVGAGAVDHDGQRLRVAHMPTAWLLRRSLLLRDRKESGAVALPTKNLPQTVPMRGSSSAGQYRQRLSNVTAEILSDFMFIC